ncbi:TIGR00366 family protein [Shivajiella indica]|uniref:TIGR00366 family protein n=1 Tax=Shivajiella indica TaxID=872115 RepID=A0ABW5BAP3_9BACT
MEKRFRFPTTFEIALLLSLFVFLLALAFTRPEGHAFFQYGFEVLQFWKTGFWELLEFTMQMVLILVLGHTLALSYPVEKALNFMSGLVKNNTHAVLLTGSLAMFAGYLNWGFGLVLGAIMARKIGEVAQRKSLKINYPLVGASGYLGMMVWHGGLSGSATLKVAEPDHFLADVTGVISIQETVFSDFNLWINFFLVLGLMLTLFFLSKKRFDTGHLEILDFPKMQHNESRDRVGSVLGSLILFLVMVDFFTAGGDWSFIDLNFVNFALIGTGLLFFRSLGSYVNGLSSAVKGATDIIIQFPFYAGILGMMKYSGLLVLLAEDMVSRSDPGFFPLLSFLSAAFVNFFIPSGGGQWAIQGPVMMEAALKMGLDIPKMIMAFAFGDQLTNMLQPFWALPLLSITGIPAKEIFKYTVYFFLIGLLVFGLGVWIFIA